jgi:hypothetical protein
MLGRLSFPLFLLLLLVVPRVEARVQLAADVTVLEPADVWAEAIEERDGALWLSIPGREAWELAPEADERWAPIDVRHVIEAWDAIDPAFRATLSVEIVILPVPRIALPISSAEDGLVYLSPGAGAAYSRRQVAFLLAHELGHCVHRAFMPDEGEAWAAYREIRGIADEAVFHDWASHAFRPREVFAEDFRYLFGGRDANYPGDIENPTLRTPDEVPGLTAFFLDLVAAPHASTALLVRPSPARGQARLVLTERLESDRGVTIFDAVGRRVARLAGPGTGARPGTVITWDGRTAAGEQAPSGVYLARLDGAAAATRFVLVQ